MSSEVAARPFSLRGVQTDVSEEISVMDREFEFFVTTQEPHRPDEKERNRIRQLVMRNFIETKWSKGNDNASENISNVTVQKKTALKSKFRLPKPGQGVVERPVKAGIKGDGKRKAVNRDTKWRSSKRSHGESQAKDQGAALSRSMSASGHESSSSEKSKRRTRLVLKINPGAGLFDPFDVLPVPGTPRLNILVKLYKSGSRINSMAINTRNSWWSFISNDAGLLHATLATWALYGMLVQEDKCDFRVQKLRHKTEAIKEINTKIGSPGNQISDELVGTVATLANFENLLGAYDAAQLHIVALKRMIKARGGLPAFNRNDGLLRGLLWVDIHTATAFRTTPTFPFIHLSPSSPPLPDALLDQAAYTSPTSLLHLCTASIECFNVFYRLHRLALATSLRWVKKVSRLAFSNMLYEMEYMLLKIPDRSREFLDFDREVRDGGRDGYEERARLADAASVIEGLLAAAQIFTYAALRDVPPRAPLFSILLSRLREALHRPSTDMLGLWSGVKNAHILLWALVVGASVAQAERDRMWWVEKLWEVAGALGVRRVEDLQGRMERVAWTDMFFGEGLAGVWQLVREHGRALEVRGKHLVQGREGGEGGDRSGGAMPEVGWMSVGGE